MKKILTAVIFTLLVSLSVFAQKTPDARDAAAVVDKLFAEMASHNPAGVADQFTKDSNLTAVIRTKDGKFVVRSFSGEAFSKNFAEKKNEIKEDMYDREIEAFDNLVLVYGRYVFFVDGKVSHCGVNAFQLVKTEAGWKIANASSTIDPTACTEKEKKRKADAGK
ncbi:MAG: hypothetical protein JSS81_20025 [Acidobacteria bacterium]|nr:hypothetical protein [Acidobacteriota bacterium]